MTEPPHGVRLFHEPKSPVGGLMLATSFQAVYCVRRRALAGHEALVRPRDAAGGAIHPSDLFAARPDEAIVRLDRASRSAHLSAFSALDDGEGMLYLNTHPLTALDDARRPLDLRAELSAHGIAPGRVCIEILESPCGDEGGLAAAAAIYKGVGLHVAMDDFGVARSNFDRVVALRPGLVKIDRSMLREAVGQPAAARMLPSVVRILHEAGTKVAIEGVENEREASLAIEAGADYLQGFLFGRPGPTLGGDAGAARLLAKLGEATVAGHRVERAWLPSWLAGGARALAA